MKLKYTLVAVVSLSLLTLGFALREDEPLKTLLSRLEKFRVDFPQEKVHLHLDKPYYSIGDTIWFKAYVVDAEKNHITGLSKILYVDLINDKDSIKQSLRLPLIAGGLGWGDFSLSDSLREGSYRIRAYTTWMRNFGEEYYFDKTISIGNVFSNTILTKADYTFTKIGNNEKVDATINYTDLGGKPVANKIVTYEVELDLRSISRGTGTTDANGDLKVSFVNNQPFLLKAGKINTHLKMDEKNLVNKTVQVKSTSDKADVQFFPEGGQLVDSVRSRVGFKAAGPDGLGIVIGGTITDKNNETVAEIKTEHAGMGVFTLTPVAGNTYTANVRFPDGSEKKVPLPRAVSEGYVLSVNTIDPENLGVRISASRSKLAEKEVTLVAQSNGVVKYVSKSMLSTPVLTAKIPKSRFQAGIVQFTLFSAANLPLAERLVFIRGNDQLSIGLAANKPAYARREKVTMDLDVKGPDGKPVISSFSVAVTNATRVPVEEAKENTIFSDLLLTSDIRGYVEEPNYYFMEPVAEKDKHLDNLMLIQGWRRFTWKNILANVYPNITFMPEQGISISGRVTSTNGKPLAGGKVTVFSTSGDGMLLDTLTDAEGKFHFKDLAFTGKTNFVIQARDAKNRKNVDIDLDRIPPQLVTKNKNAADIQVNVTPLMLTYLKSRNDEFAEMRKNGMLRRSIVLNEVKVSEKKKPVTNSSNLNGAGNADAIIKAEQLQTCQTLAQCLQGRVAGLIIQNGIAYLTRAMNSSFQGPVPMQLIVDGIYQQPDMLSIINPNDVETIEVLKSAGNTAIYGINGGGGVLIITTKRGGSNLDYTKFAPGITSYSPLGYYLGRAFYSPNYENPETNTRLPDVRSTIYWNPHVVTNEGKAKLEFYTSDGAGTYRTVVEGLSQDGKLGRKVLYYTVK
ncbi:TonB-dependent receptor plug domain-containing protein [Pedobacter sp. HMF7056]|uniref:TonB-dependent receptor plug domain-containing protein n=2 Tax=Hufsiella ginkgonis TaxID=2695274 RepID=A0A7K1Y2R5_9SPHI|nr:TonB-dependent receptor plug domain-containing protein [Hufsiella ginkgonis]